MHLPLSTNIPTLAITTAAVQSPTARTKMGLMGLNFGRTIVDALLSERLASNFELTALCDKDRGVLAGVALSSNVARYRDLDEMLEDDDVEAVGVFTGPIGRAALIRKIIRTGRHVMTTKPLEMDPETMKDVLCEARERGVVIHSNSPSPIIPQDLKVIRRWVSEFDLGRPVGAHADVWVSYREPADGTWYDNSQLCPAPPIFRLGIYLINDLMLLLGKFKSAQVAESRIFTGRPTSDNAQISMLFENKALATIYASFCVNDGDHYRNGLTLNYENGTIYRNTGPAWSVAPAGISKLALVQSVDNRPFVRSEEVVLDASGSYDWDYFRRAIQGHTDPDELTPDQMVEGIRVIQSMAAQSKNVPRIG